MSLELSNDTSDNLPDNPIEFSNLSQLALLTQKQKNVLFYMLQSFMNVDDISTDVEIARLAGCDRATVFNCRNNPAFLSVYSHFIKEISKSRVGTVVNRLYKMTDKSEKAIETYLKYTDQLIEKQQRLNANINYTTDSGNHLENLVSMLKTAGYTLDRLVGEITDIWNSL